MDKRLIISSIVGLISVSALATFWATADQSNDASGALLKPNDPTVVAIGAELYVSECATCHGENLEGQPNWRRPGSDGLMPAPPHDETGHTWHHTDDVLFGITKYGVAKFAGLKDHKSAMPAYEGELSDQEIIAVLSYIKSQWPANIIERHDQMNALIAPK